MALVVLVEALGVEEVDVGYGCMSDCDGEVFWPFWLWWGDLFGSEVCEVLRESQWLAP